MRITVDISRGEDSFEVEIENYFEYLPTNACGYDIGRVWRNGDLVTGDFEFTAEEERYALQCCAAAYGDTSWDD